MPIHDENQLIEAYICAGRRGVVEQLPDSSQEEINDMFVYLCANGNTELAQMLQNRVTIGMEQGFAAAANQIHLATMEWLRPQIDLPAVLPKVWQRACYSCKEEVLDYLLPYTNSSHQYLFHEAALSAVLRNKPHTVAVMLEQLYGPAQHALPVNGLVKVVLTDAITLVRPKVVSAILPFCRPDDVTRLLEKSAADEDLFGPTGHQLFERCVINHAVGPVDKPKTARKM